MSLPKLFERIFWHNNTTPAINEDNLNAMSQAIDEIDDRVIMLGDDVLTVVPQIQAYLEQAEDLVEAMETLSQNPPYIGANGNWYVWDTEDQEYQDSGVDASITVDIEDITMLATDATPYVTNTGTDTDPVFHLFIPRGATGLPGQDGTDGTDGVDGVSPTVTITSITNGHRVTITDADHPQGQSFDVMNGQDGQGSGDMTKAVYDSDNAVATAGGIKAFIQSLGYITGLAWSALTGKPFSSIGSGLTVTSNTLSADVQSVTVGTTGTASASAVSYQRIGVNGAYTEIDGTKYMEQTKTISTSADTTYTFSNSDITADSDITVKASVWGISPSNVVTTSGQCVVTIPKQSSAISLGIRIYIR